MCGWLIDKFGVSWQIIPKHFSEMICNPDPERSERVMKALLQTKAKINMKSLEQAYEV
ncbi:VOC family protein [Paenibacillus spongiae]|uniref:VOC family protein n=1 Tax=Paenibacillus spongiae TaxID=2909671 RepID=A0ABY5SLB3_9BACL|nr:VOC family protein [Paenibacillus spongiae]UVI33460.1 VOC family protein [Paenibacillus spongiae]